MVRVAIVLQSGAVDASYGEMDLKICADGAGNDHSLDPDFVIGDMDSYRVPDQARRITEHNAYGGTTWSYGSTMIIQNPDQDSTDFQKCLEHLRRQTSHCPTELWIYGGLEGRLDHTISVLHTLHTSTFGYSVRLLSGGNTMIVLDQGTHSFPYNAVKDASIGVFAFLPTHVATKGLKWDFDRVVQMGDFISTSNTATDSIEVVCSGRSFLLLCRL